MAEQAYLDNVKSTYVTDCHGVKFDAISSNTNGKGVYEMASTKDDAYPIYYYRGAVNNNNVKFGGFCWKAVRTTNTGGVKLVYNGAPDARGYCTNTTGEATQIGTSKFNENNNSPAYVGYMYGTTNGLPTGTPYTITGKSVSSSDTYKYGKGVDYLSGTYTLTNTVDTIDNSHHYTCFSSSTTCDTVYYVYYKDGSTYYYYIPISGVNPNGRELIDVVKESMFRNDKDSTAKIEIEKWYENNLISVSGKIEDTVYCNDRSTSVKSGWNADESMTSYLYFSGRTRTWNTHEPSLACERANDRFTVSPSIGNGKLRFPVGLLTTDEIMLAGGIGGSSNRSYYLYTNQYYLAGSPNRFNDNRAYEISVTSGGGINNVNVSDTTGLRPVVSLSRTSSVSGGDGTANNPYVIG